MMATGTLQVKSFESRGFGSIYFAGTDPGRYLVTALSKSHVNADPFFTVTQNALADSRSYLRYLHGMYGSRLYIPTEEDVTRSINAYKEDVRRRQSQGKLMPGEVIEELGSELEIRGQVGVMAINGLLSQLMFDRNPDREFYVEESFPLSWMYPHLAPNKLVLKIHRQPLSGIPANLILQDHDYWTHYVGPMIGTWLNDLTSVGEIVAFVEKVYVQKDLNGFAGDPAYVQSGRAQRIFSKLRSSIGGLYAWRAQECESSAEKQHMLAEADFAFRQAFALYPASPEVVFRYVGLLVSQKHLDEAIVVAETAVKLEAQAKPRLEPNGHGQEDFSHKPMIESQTSPPRLLTQLGSLLEQLKRMRRSELTN